MSHAGSPTDNSAIKAINGWLKEELLNELNIKDQICRGFYFFIFNRAFLLFFYSCSRLPVRIQQYSHRVVSFFQTGFRM